MLISKHKAQVELIQITKLNSQCKHCYSSKTVKVLAIVMSFHSNLMKGFSKLLRKLADVTKKRGLYNFVSISGFHMTKKDI